MRNALGQYMKGHSETLGEKMARSKSLSEGWRNRPNYIGDIVNECPRLYNSWRSIRFTEKGKRAGCCAEWADYRQFYNDVRPSFTPNRRLVRKDITQPWSPQNFMYATDAEIGIAKVGVILTYNGESLALSQWADKLGVSVGAIKQRYYKHKDWPVEYILKGKPRNRNSKTAKDITNSTTPLRAKASKMISSYRMKDVKNGLQPCDIDIDWMVRNILLRPCVYCGDTYRIGCDRIDNNKGHTKDNVVPCCIECNTARNNYFTFDEMKKLGKTISEIKSQRPPRVDGKSMDEIEDEARRDVKHQALMMRKPIYQFSARGELMGEYLGARAAAMAVGAAEGTIRDAANGQKHGNGINKHKALGFFWSHNKDFKINEP